MRLSEKTLEINICAQINGFSKQRIIWFGLTQKQEARAGFDVYSRIGGRLIIFQFKASNQIIRGWRRFNAKHAQMENLRNQCSSYQRSVFYAFPLVGTTHELSKDSNLLSQTWLLDVDSLPPLDPPRKRNGALRKKGIHYVDVVPRIAIIHSEPIEINLIPLIELIESDFPETDGIGNLFDQNFEDFWNFRRSLLFYSAAGIITCNEKFASL